MKNLTTPQAILFGFGLVALAIASIPYSSQIVTPAFASRDGVNKIAICDVTGTKCAHVLSQFDTKGSKLEDYKKSNRLFVSEG